MKLNTKKNLIYVALCSLPLFFAACQDEPAVGSTLFEEDGNAGVVKAFIDNYCFYPKNTMQSHLVQTGVGGALNMEETPVSIKVRLTNPATKDLTFSLQVDNSGVKPEEEGTTVIGEDAIAFAKQTVTVHAGETESRDELSFSLNKEAASLKDFTTAGVLSMALVSKDGVETVQGYNTYMWKMTKEITNINNNGNLKDKTMMEFGQYEVLKSFYGTLSPTQDLSDSSTSSYIMLYANTKNNIIPVRFHAEQAVAGISISPFQYFGSWDMSCCKVEILAGPDKDNLQRVGIATWGIEKPADETPWEIAFFGPVTMKYMEIRAMENFTKGTSTNVIIPEIRIYK